jgi:hypothetical protein
VSLFRFTFDILPSARIARFFLSFEESEINNIFQISVCYFYCFSFKFHPNSMSRGQTHGTTPTLMLTISFRFRPKRQKTVRRDFYGLTGTFLKWTFIFMSFAIFFFSSWNFTLECKN